ncbi:YceD family protein [Caminibacter sp.]
MNVNKTLNGLTLKGESEKNKDGSIVINGKLEGMVEVECVKCLKPFKKEINEEVKFKVVKPPYEGFDEEYDIIEQEKYDLEEILKSEIESIKNDYNICDECKNEEFNKNF